MNEKKGKPGSLRVKIEGDWVEAVAKALQKKRPEGGWPAPKPMPCQTPKTTRNRKKPE